MRGAVPERRCTHALEPGLHDAILAGLSWLAGDEHGHVGDLGLGRELVDLGLKAAEDAIDPARATIGSHHARTPDR